MSLVSIIVPVYNVEPYIETCIQSLIRQTMGNIEVILVDDGSTDRSGELCDQYAEADERIRVIHKQNGGLSSARNAGILSYIRDSGIHSRFMYFFMYLFYCPWTQSIKLFIFCLLHSLSFPSSSRQELTIIPSQCGMASPTFFSVMPPPR